MNDNITAAQVKAQIELKVERQTRFNESFRTYIEYLRGSKRLEDLVVEADKHIADNLHDGVDGWLHTEDAVQDLRALIAAAHRIRSGLECSKYVVSYQAEDIAASKGRSTRRCTLDDGHNSPCYRPASNVTDF